MPGGLELRLSSSHEGVFFFKLFYHIIRRILMSIRVRILIFTVITFPRLSTQVLILNECLLKTCFQDSVM
jgi:hypothetical protein